MRHFNIAVLHRSINIYRQFTLGSILEKGSTASKVCGLSNDYFDRRFNATEASQTTVINQTQSKSKSPSKKKALSTNKVTNTNGSSVTRGNSKSGAQATLGVVNSSKSNDEANEIKQLREHIARFFARYPKFKYDPTQPYTAEFLRMIEEFGWPKDSEEYKIARRKLNTASVLQFNANFDKEDRSGSKKNKKGRTLRKWIKLFNKINIKDSVMPKTVPEFEERVKSVHTNICDVLDADVTNKKSTDWGNEVTLSQYTRRTEKFFPRDHPLAGTLLRHLLRHILCPSPTRGFEKEGEIKQNK